MVMLNMDKGTGLAESNVKARRGARKIINGGWKDNKYRIAVKDRISARGKGEKNKIAASNSRHI